MTLLSLNMNTHRSMFNIFRFHCYSRCFFMGNVFSVMADALL